MFNLLDVVRINDSSSMFHKKKAVIVKIGTNNSFYDVEVIETKTRIRVVPGQLLATKN